MGELRPISLGGDRDFDNPGALPERGEEKGPKCGEEESVLRAANSASYFSLISCSFLALQLACVRSALAATAALVPVIFLAFPVFIWKAAKLGFFERGR